MTPVRRQTGAVRPGWPDRFPDHRQAVSADGWLSATTELLLGHLQERGARVERKHVFGLIAVVSLVNGLFSPFTMLVLQLFPFWFPGFLNPTMPLLITFSAILTAFATLLLSGIPAAVFERVTSRPDSDLVSLYLWLAGAVLVTTPAFFVINQVV